MASDRLTPLDSSFLRIESRSAHMHVGWRGAFRPDPRARAGDRRRGARARSRGACRTPTAFASGWCSRRPGSASPCGSTTSGSTCATTCGRSPAPASRSRAGGSPRSPTSSSRGASIAGGPLWQIGLVPRLRDGTFGMVMKIHHAMVDGKSAVALALLLLDADPDQPVPAADDRWEPAARPNGARLALDALLDTGEESLRMAAGIARAAGSPTRGVRLAETLRRAALSAGEDLLRPAPSSFLNGPIGPRRRLLAHAAPMRELLDIKQHCRRHAERRRPRRRRRSAAPARARAGNAPAAAQGDGAREHAGARGGRSAREPDLVRVHPAAGQSRRPALRDCARSARRRAASRRSAGPPAARRSWARSGTCRSRSSRARPGSRRARACTTSRSRTSPGPRVPVYLLGAPLVEAFPVVPLSDGHALSIGMFSYRDRMFFGVHAEPDALPDAGRLPGALNGARVELRRAALARAAARAGRATPSPPARGVWRRPPDPVIGARSRRGAARFDKWRCAAAGLRA